MAADFSPEGLVAAAKNLFGEPVLLERVLPKGDRTAKEKELLRIARSVISHVQGAAQSNVGWPLPGVWPAGSVDLDGATIAGTPYREVWTDDLLNYSLALFNYRTYDAREVVPEEVRRRGKDAEQFFLNVAKGVIGLGLGVETDTTPAEPFAARDRQGRNLLRDGAPDSERIMDDLFT